MDKIEITRDAMLTASLNIIESNKEISEAVTAKPLVALLIPTLAMVLWDELKKEAENGSEE